MPVDFIKPQSSRYAKILLDFSYFEKRLIFDEYVSSNEEGRSLDEDFFAQFTNYLNQFSRMLDALFSLLHDYMEYAERSFVNFNLLDRRYVKLNSLKCKTLFLLGVVLLLIEAKFPGLIKERIFVAIYRTNMNFATRKFELLVSILRNRKENFESCFQHIQINETYVEQMINFLRYYATQQPDSTETDGFTNEKLMSMIYVCLFFKSDILHNQFSIMRQIVDKYFQSDYIIPIHLELTVNLMLKWEPYKAASSTLQTEIKAKRTSMFNSSMSTPPISSQELFNAVVKVSHFEHKLKQSCLYIIAHKAEDATRLKSRICNIFDQIVLLINSQMLQDCSWN
uniref:Uncharacterized protein n=1 Tax=Acrobeloides nanus TaxID=290746 RepID=A0A914EH19_9BILA